MIVMLEIYPPFRKRPKVERYGPMIRIIWGWFSISYISAGINEVGEAFRRDEREKANAEIKALRELLCGQDSIRL